MNFLRPSLLALACLLASPVIASDLPSLGDSSSSIVSPMQEHVMGRAWLSMLRGQVGQLDDPQLKNFVEHSVYKLAETSQVQDRRLEFVLIDSAQLNAFAAPGGYVFVTKGLIDRCADESELAGILAHEITHVTAKHHLQAIRQSAMAGVGTQLLASQIRTSNIAGQLVKDQLLSLFRTVYTKGLSQSDEFEADRTGVSLAAKAGFDPYGLVSVLQQLRTVTPDNPMFTLTMSTHPAAQARLDYLEQSMGRQLDGLGGSRASIAQRLGGSAPANAPAPSARPAAAKKAG